MKVTHALRINFISSLKSMWFFTMFMVSVNVIVFYYSQGFGLKSRQYIYPDPIQQRVDLTYWRFNYTESDDLNDILSLKFPNYLQDYKNPCWQEAVHIKGNIKFKLRCLPYFYLLGADKCGTTDLFQRIQKHPEIIKINAYMNKETMWWAWTRFGYDIYTKRVAPESFFQYLKRFNSPIHEIQRRNIPLGNGLVYHQCVFGDGSPISLWDFTGWKKIPQNHGLTMPKYLTPHCIHHLTPKAKFIIIFRNPIDRLYSDFLYVRSIHKGFNSSQRVRSRENFHVQVVQSINNLKTCIHKYSLKFCLFNKLFHLESFLRFEIGFYSVYLKEWFNVFPRDQFYILRSEDYKENITGHLKNIFHFLNLTKLTKTELKKMKKGKLVNTRPKDVKFLPPMFQKTRKLLKDLYQPFNNELAILLKDDRYQWVTET